MEQCAIFNNFLSCKACNHDFQNVQLKIMAKQMNPNTRQH